MSGPGLPRAGAPPPMPTQKQATNTGSQTSAPCTFGVGWPLLHPPFEQPLLPTAPPGVQSKACLRCCGVVPQAIDELHSTRRARQRCDHAWACEQSTPRAPAAPGCGQGLILMSRSVCSGPRISDSCGRTAILGSMAPCRPNCRTETQPSGFIKLATLGSRQYLLCYTDS
jgi:hypothetical protein